MSPPARSRRRDLRYDQICCWLVLSRGSEGADEGTASPKLRQDSRALSSTGEARASERYGDEAELGDEALLAGDEQADALGRGRHQFFSAFRASQRGGDALAGDERRMCFAPVVGLSLSIWGAEA